MPKHPHRLLLVQKKTWRCTLPNCRYFIHRGLEHTLPGQTAKCWECGDDFTLDERALQDDMPICDSCRMGRDTGMSSDEMSDIIEVKMVLGKRKLKHIRELSDREIQSLQNMGVLPKKIPQVFYDEADKYTDADKPEVIEPGEE